MEEMADYCH